MLGAATIGAGRGGPPPPGASIAARGDTSAEAPRGREGSEMEDPGGSRSDVPTDGPSDTRAFFESAVARLMDRLYATALRFTRDPADAEDVMAEALIKAWTSIHSLADRASFDGWMMRILSNTFVSQWRRKRCRDELFDDAVGTDDLDDGNSLYARLHQPFLLWFGTPEQTFVNELLKEDIERALDALADGYRAVVVMVEILGFSYAEVAEELGIPLGTVRSRLNRGRRQMQDALWPHAREARIAGEKRARGEKGNE